jgi:hypothetical protein
MTCKWCGRSCKETHGGGYCSAKCAAEHKAATRPDHRCDWCGSSAPAEWHFTGTYNGHPAKYGRFCGRRCIDQAKTAGYTKEQWPVWDVELYRPGPIATLLTAA